MDIYTNAQKGTYVTGITKRFVMPTDSGGIPVVAVSKRTSTFITSTYTILIILIFAVGWNLIIDIIMAFWPTRRDPNRRTVLVALWNSGESMNATRLMVSYCKRAILYMLGGNPEEAPSDPEAKGDQSHQGVAGHCPKTGSNEICPAIESVQLVGEKHNRVSERSPASNAKCGVSDLLWGLLFVFIALAMSVGNIAAGILVPAQLSAGNVAPVAKDAIFYPEIPSYFPADDNSGVRISKLMSLFASPALRALGSTEGSKVAVRKRISLSGESDGASSPITYSYNVTGVDMGLQSYPKLRLMVNGSCQTDDTWLLNSTDRIDTYRLFGGNETLPVEYPPGVVLPPMLQFVVNPYRGKGPNTSYAMIIDIGGRYSYTPGQGPWYVTERSAVDVPIPYQMSRKRPVLSCWESSTWHLNGKGVDILKLGELPGLKLGSFWVKVFQLEFGIPRVVTVGTLAGQFALKSTSYSTPHIYILDAGKSTIKGDLERLLLAAWVSSRNVLRDTTTYDRDGMQNKAEGPAGSVEASKAQFVLQSGDVVTLSIRILISVPSILLVLLFFQRCLSCALSNSRIGKTSILPGEKRNAVALLATQLYRRLDQGMSSRDWEHTESLIPFVYPSEIEGPIVETDPEEKLGGANTQGRANAEDR